MTISLVSAAASGGNPLAAITGDTAASGDIFSSLFGRLLAGEQGVDLLDVAFDPEFAAALDTDLSAALTQLKALLDSLNPALDAALDPDLSAALTQLQAQLEDSTDIALLDPALLAELANADAAALSQLPEEVQSLLRDIKKRLAQEDEAETQIPLLGALSTPIELPQEIVSGLANLGGARADADAHGATQLLQHMRGLEKAVAELLPSKSANLAAGAEDFGQLLRENLLQGQVQNQSTLGTSAQSASPTANLGGQGLQTPVMSPAWAQEFGEKIVWMARSGQQTAQLSLNPAHLGPLTINLNLDSDKASATFTATTAEVRQAIEEAMPRLREMLAAAGVALGETSVGTQTRQEWHTAQQQAAQQEAENNARNAREARSDRDGAILEDHLPAAHAARTQHGVSMVDLFA